LEAAGEKRSEREKQKRSEKRKTNMSKTVSLLN